MINVRIINKEQIIVPIRFVRAVSGPPQNDAPDIDNRGCEMGTRTPSWGVSDARGAMVGIMQGHTVRIKVLREDIDAGAPLYVTSTDTGVVEVIAPVDGGPIPADGIFQIKGVADYCNRPVSVQVKLGSVDGPVLGELEPHIFIRRRVKVRVHRCTINGTPVLEGGVAIPATTALSFDDIDDMFDIANAFWKPTGVEFQVISRKDTTTTLTARPGNTPAPNNQSHQGCITEDNSNTWFAQADELVRINRRQRTVNVYFVRCIWNAEEAAAGNSGRGTMGIGTSVTSATHYGVVLADGSDENDLAHELAHVLNLDFHGGGNLGHADDTAAGSSTRDTLWTRRRLMYSFNPYGSAGDGSPAYLTDIGYGAYVRGGLITVKNIDGDDTDNETSEANRRSRHLP